MILIRKLLIRVLAVSFGFLLFFLMAELVLCLFPVNEGLRLQALNDANPVHRFEPNRVSVWSEGWNFSYVNRVRVNNYGFVNDHDYDPTLKSPLLAVIGDSYIEAAMVPFRETLHGRLQENLGDNARVYSFGASGQGLSAYLAFAEYARDEFRPDVMAFVIIRNDFRESLAKYENNFTYYFVGERAEDMKIIRRDYEPSPLRRILRRSRLFMYLMTNVKLQSHLPMPVFLGDKDAITHIPTDTHVAEFDVNELQRDSEQAVLAFFRFLPEKSGLSPDRIIIALDGLRGIIYPTQVLGQDDYFAQMRDFILREGKSRGFNVVDMHAAFVDDYTVHGKKFEFDTDSHWNGEGHRVAAEAVAKSAVFGKQFMNIRQDKSLR